MKTKKLLLTRCTMETTSWLLVIISMILVHSTQLSYSAPTTEINSPDKDHAAGILPTATIAPATMTPLSATTRTLPMNTAKSWPSQKPSRSKHITKSNPYKKISSKDKVGRAKVPFLSSTLVPSGYDVEKDISRHKEAAITTTTTLATTIDTVVDNVNSPKDYNNKDTTNTSALRHFDSQSAHSLLGVSDILSTNANDDGDSGKDIDFISDSKTTKADETHATTEGYHAKAPTAQASSSTTMPTSRVENPVSIMETIPIQSQKGVVKSIISSPSTFSYSNFSGTYHESKSMSVNASASFASPSTLTTTTTTVSPSVKQPDVGHDGVKVTKKKQLFDKHFIAASASPSGSIHSSIQRKDKPSPALSTLSKNKPTKSNAGSGGKKLMEVPNGYLGPIMMKEKTFSVSHSGKKPKPKHHQPSLVEQKLKDKKLVEIIAPTALMEPISKAKNSQPDFVAIDRMVTAATVPSTTTTTTTAATTTTEGVKTSTDNPTKEQSKKKEIESETATTYFLVVNQDGQASTKEIAGETTRQPINPEMEPLNSGEIETTLREIYAEVIHAMEGGSRPKTTSTEVAETSTDAPFSEKPLINVISSTSSSIYNQDETSETLHIFEQNKITSATVNPPIDESPIQIQEFTSSATNTDIRTITDNVPKSLTKSQEKKDPTDLPKTKKTNILPTISTNFEQGQTLSLITNCPEFYSPISKEASVTEGPILADETKTTSSTVPSKIDEKAYFEVLKVQKFVEISSTSRSETSVTDVLVESTETQASSKLDVNMSDNASKGTQLEPILSGETKSLTTIAYTSTTEGVETPKSITEKNLEVLTTAQETSPRTTDFTPLVQHDSSSTSTSQSPVTEAPIQASSQKEIVLPATTENSQPAESKISNIQFEVSDSTLQPIVAATNFKHNPVSTKHSPNREHTQERFTQYIVNKTTDFANQESSSMAKAPGKPEPAAIEIHINVSEGFGNESEDLEFLYRQSDFRKFPSSKPSNSLKPPSDATAPQNETSNEAAEEIVVEIIDTNSNSTENSGSRENLNVNPVFTFRSDDDSQVELKNVKYYPEDRPIIKDGFKSTDDFFVPHVGEPALSSASSSSGAQKPLMDRDSDTIFYISNTEVKVGESLPTANTYDTQLKKSRLESQFFPANYEEHKNKPTPQRYEEDIILSPSPSKNGPLKVIRRPLDISYVGESIMEVEQVTLTSTVPVPPEPDAASFGSTPDVIIEPAVLPEMAIGVPVIGELPPQIELKEIDYMPNFDGNKEESSIQYGGDLIDEGGAMGVGFDMDSYPLGNLGGMGGNRDGAAISTQMLFNHRMNHLKKDVLTADLGGLSSETIADGNDLLRQANDSVVNGTAGGEKMGNATAYSVFEDQIDLNDIMQFLTPRTLLFIGIYTIIPLVLVIFLIFIWRDYNRKYKRNPFNAMGRNSSTDPLDAEKANGGGDGDADGLETPEEDISRDTRVTKMHYNNSEKDGVFVVEVSRGADSKIMPSSPVDDKRPFNIDADVKIVQSDTQTLLPPNHEKVQVHAPPPENLINHDDIDTNHLHQIDEVDEFEECPKITKNSNTGLSQSDLSSSSSVDSNKRYSYGNQELYTIEKQDYSTPSPIATKAPHPHGDAKPPQPENHNDDNGHAENGGHCLEKSPTKPASSPKCADSSITQSPPPPPPPSSSTSLSLSASSDKVHQVNGQHENAVVVAAAAVETKPKITAALLKQDTVVVNEVTNGSSSHVINGCENNEEPLSSNEDNKPDDVTPQAPAPDDASVAVMDTNMSTEPFAAEIKTLPDYNGSINTENGFDSIISLPDPPSSDEIKQMNDIILMETNQLDSLPPPPPPEIINNHQYHNGNGNGLSSLDQNGDSHSIVSDSPSPMQTPTKMLKPLVPPTITVADTSALTESSQTIVHTNGNCMTGHAIAVEVSGSS